MHRIRVNDQVTVSSQPSTRELANLAAAGFQSILDVRTREQLERPMTPEVEGQRAEELGLTYRHLQLDPVGPAAFVHLQQALDLLPRPVLIHCWSPVRVSALAATDAGDAARAPRDKALGAERAAGLHCIQRLVALVERYLDNRPQPPVWRT